MRHSPTIPERQRLPNRRAAETFELEVAGLHYVVSVGRFADGRLAETFITNGKAGSSADTAVGDAAIILSFALQYGADAEAIRRAVSRNSKGEPSGVMGAVLDRLAEDGVS
jgi:hypothetical protein